MSLSYVGEDSKIAELVYTCQDLSDYHITVYWSKWSATLVARELSELGLDCFPQNLREDALKGRCSKIFETKD